jgi:hypothetical protein
MTSARHTIVNAEDRPIYISIEPAPECYELEPGETLTMIYDLPAEGDAFSIAVIDEGLSITPFGDEPEVLINGVSADGRSWKFKHHETDNDSAGTGPTVGGSKPISDADSGR